VLMDSSVRLVVSKCFGANYAGVSGVRRLPPDGYISRSCERQCLRFMLKAVIKIELPKRNSVVNKLLALGWSG